MIYDVDHVFLHRFREPLGLSYSQLISPSNRNYTRNNIYLFIYVVSYNTVFSRLFLLNSIALQNE